MQLLARQFKMIGVMLALALVSTWALYHYDLESSLLETKAYNAPDYFMEDFTTIAMDEKGNPRYQLAAIYMAHYGHNNTTEVLNPKIEFYRNGKEPFHVEANKGWLTADNEVVLLNGDVRFIETDKPGEDTMQIFTEKARLLINQNYAETDEFARVITKRTAITGTGMRVNFDQGKLNVLNDVKTIIENE